MVPHRKSHGQISLFSSLEDTLSQKHPLYILADKVHWHIFEEAFLPLYCQDNGRPAKPIRLMVGLLILKHIRDVPDESVLEQWSENVYCQYFCGETTFVPSAPCEASQLVHFRNRIGESGFELILKESIRINGDDSNDDNVNIDTTVQEKNITYPADAKPHNKIIDECKQIVEQERLPIRQTYTRTLKRLSIDQRFRNHPKNRVKARKADKKTKTIAGRLVRELERNLPADSKYHGLLNLFKQILPQTRKSRHKIHSIHEPEVCCISKARNTKNMSLAIRRLL